MNRSEGVRSRYLQEEEVTAHLPAVRIAGHNSHALEKRWWNTHAEFFDLFNHANFGQPSNVVGSPAFGRITNTRFPTGESGSSRQIQFAMRLMF
jgi:hypothetical protein